VGYQCNGYAYRDRCADRNHQSSAQIERDFSAASLVFPSNRGSMDARYFQAQLCSLVNFLHLVHPEDMSPKSMLTKEVNEALPPHGFSVPDLYPERV